MSMMNIQNNETQKVVTMKDIAEYLGISYVTARDAYYGKSSPQKCAAVKAVAERMGYNPKAAQMEGIKRSVQTMRNRVKLSDVAREAGVSTHTVAMVLGNNASQYSAETAKKVKEAVSKLGYKTQIERAQERQAAHNKTQNERAKKWQAAHGQKFYCNGNFHTKQEEIARMRELRAEGYSNAEIAQKVGRSHMTVLKNIGKQPEDMTRMNVLEGNHARANRNTQRRTYVMTHEINQHNELVKRVEKINASIVETEQNLMHLRREQAAITAKIAENVPRIRKLSAQTGVKMQELPLNLSDLAPTAVQ